jgi:amidase
MITRSDDVHWREASTLAAQIRLGELSCVEVVRTFMHRIEELDRHYNAFLSVVPESTALEMAKRADAELRSGAEVGPLHGLPIAVKDLMDVAGLPTTHGTTVHGHIATCDSVLAGKLRTAGAIIIGKTNTPEHGLGTLTFNRLGGPTLNPWDRSRHAGGSSGGAAAAVAAGMLPLADGSDSGGSIRYPASFCNLVGLRPTPGRVPSGRTGDAWSPHGVLGPITRSVRDAGLLLDAISGPDMRAPLSFAAPQRYRELQPANLTTMRIGWSPDLGGLPIDPEVRAVLAAFRARLVQLGCQVEDVDFLSENVDRCWEIIEMLNFYASCGEDVGRHRASLRPDLVRNVDQGRALTAEEITWALTERTEIYRRTARLLERFDVVACPATPVFAPPAAVDWVRVIEDTPLDRYFLWQRCASRVTVTAHPAVSLPAGFSKQGLPLGVQLVGRYFGEAKLLECALSIDIETEFSSFTPVM